MTKELTANRQPLTAIAEWAPQKRIWLSWPHARGDWPEKFGPIPWVFAEIIRTITASNQRVGLLVKDAKTRAEAMEMLDRSGVELTRVDMLEIKTNRGWMRDCGPVWVKTPPPLGRGHNDPVDRLTGVEPHAHAVSDTISTLDTSSAPLLTSPLQGEELLALDWKFTGWAKYANHQLDNRVPGQVCAFTKHQVITPTHKGKPVVLEGGGIEVDGAGSILVTEEWLLSDTQIRNPGFTRADYEAVFAKYLGVTNTIWLGAGIVGDDTHGHIDDITRFVSPNTVVTVMEPNQDDPNHAILSENRARLARTALNVIELPMPAPVMFEGQRLPASYANFLICNHVVLVPVFNDAHDRTALNTLAACFPTRQVIPIYARDLVWGLGTIHCLTQQEPG